MKTKGPAYAGLAMLCMAVGLAAIADVRDTKHNLAKRLGQQTRDVDSKEVCVFCHFPSVADGDIATAPVTAPTWQRSIDVTHSFSVYDDVGRLNVEGNAAVGSQSIACLACHDSNMAFSISKLPSIEHPFGVPYRGGKISRTAAEAARAKLRTETNPFQEARSQVNEVEFRPHAEGTLGGRRIFWVSSQGTTVRRGKSDLPLYSRGRGGPEVNGEEVPYVECTSCHDPHTTSPLFLRVANERNRLCLTCHDK